MVLKRLNAAGWVLGKGAPPSFYVLRHLMKILDFVLGFQSNYCAERLLSTRIISLINLRFCYYYCWSGFTFRSNYLSFFFLFTTPNSVEIGSPVAQGGLKSLNCWSSCLYHPRTKNTTMSHHIWFYLFNIDDWRYFSFLDCRSKNKKSLSPSEINSLIKSLKEIRHFSNTKFIVETFLWEKSICLA